MADTKRPTSRRAKDSGGGAPVCPVGICPVGMFLTVTGEARPEVVEHLVNAGRELVLAATAFLAARAEAVKERPRLERIELD